MNNHRRFLVTGLPRTRTAWLAAVFSGDGVTAVHDTVWHGGPERTLLAIRQTPGAVGLFDPGAACVYPCAALDTFGGHPVVVIGRPEADCAASLARWMNAPALPSSVGWGLAFNNYRMFLGSHKINPMLVDYGDLDDCACVARIYRYCTGLELPAHRFRLMSGLRVEQHKTKAMNMLDHWGM